MECIFVLLPRMLILCDLCRNSPGMEGSDDMLIKCTACGVTLFLAIELMGLPCFSVPDHHCHAAEPHTHSDFDIRNAPQTDTTAAGSGSISLTPLAGELVMGTDVSTVVLN
jgi:hypothetical protein